MRFCLMLVYLRNRLNFLTLGDGVGHFVGANRMESKVCIVNCYKIIQCELVKGFFKLAMSIDLLLMFPKINNPLLSAPDALKA